MIYSRRTFGKKSKRFGRNTASNFRAGSFRQNSKRAARSLGICIRNDRLRRTRPVPLYVSPAPVKVVRKIRRRFAPVFFWRLHLIPALARHGRGWLGRRAGISSRISASRGYLDTKGGRKLGYDRRTKIQSPPVVVSLKTGG
jgi:hypothetical protein